MTKHLPLQHWTVGFIIWRQADHRPGTGLWQSARVMSHDQGWYATRWSTGGHGTREAAIESVQAYYPNHVIVVQDDDAWITRCEECGHGHSSWPLTCSQQEAHSHFQDHRSPFVPCAWFDEVRAYQADGERYAHFLDTAAKRLQSARLNEEYRQQRMARNVPQTATQALQQAAWINKPVRISVPVYLGAYRPS